MSPPLALRHPLCEHVHTVVDVVEHQLAVAGCRGIVEIGLGQSEGEHVAYHAAVGVGGQQGPVVVFAHAQQRLLALGAALLKRGLQQLDGVGLLVGGVERGIAAVFQTDIAVVVDVLSGVAEGVAVVHLAVAVPDYLHPGGDAFLAVYHLSIGVDEEYGQVGAVQGHTAVVGAVVVPALCHGACCREE